MSEAPNIYEETNKKLLQYFEDITSNADDVQKRVLREILSRNADVEYLQRHGLNGSTDPEAFKKVIPIVTYEDLKPDIDRIAYGDFSAILCSQPISEFFRSSGTSGGECKLIPTTEEEVERRSILVRLSMAVMDQFVLEKGKRMHFLLIKPDEKTPGGLLASPITTSRFKSSYSKNKPNDPYATNTSPSETILCLDTYQSMYSQMLCGLCQNTQVVRIGALFASNFIRAIGFLENHWPLLCNDIKTGTLNPKITDPSVREAVMRILKPNPKLAELVEAECSKESWEGIIQRLWPNTKYIDAIVTGTMSPYVPILNYYSNNLPLASTLYASSECNFGLNINPFCKPSEVAYTHIPTVAYFEFLPVARDDDRPVTELVDLVDVKLGHEYEIVVTTYAGLYRYWVGDILRVVGFKNKAPQFQFICRKNVALSIDAEKTDEVELQDAVAKASAHLLQFEASLTEYTSYADMSTIPGHYVLYWEIIINKTQVPSSVFEQCCLTIEESLNSVYRECHTLVKSIGPLELRIVETGTFDKLMDYAISNGTSISQYKVPRCVKSVPIIELLNSKVISNFFSPTYPQWAPDLRQWSA